TCATPRAGYLHICRQGLEQGCGAPVPAQTRTASLISFDRDAVGRPHGRAGAVPRPPERVPATVSAETKLSLPARGPVAPDRRLPAEHCPPSHHRVARRFPNLEQNE